MKKIRLGVIGTGLAWQRLHYPAISKMPDKYEVVALANRSRKDAEEFAKAIHLDTQNVYENYFDLLKREDIDAVLVAVPIEQNYDVSENVARTGFDFICEKPMASTLKDAEKFVELSKTYGVKIMIAENYRYNEENNKLREIVHGGRLGNVAYFISNRVFDFREEMKRDTFAEKEWRQHPAYRGGTFLDAAVHDIAAFRHIFGPVESVQALGKPQQEDFCPYVSIHTNILFKSGVIGQFNFFPSGIELQRPLVGFRIFGSSGMAYLEEKSCGAINITTRDGKKEQVSYTPEQGYYNEFMNFYHALTGKEEISVTPEIEFGDVKMAFDILKSVEKREIVYVD